MQDNLFWGALVTSVCLLFVEHLGRWADSHRSTYWMRPWYFLLNLCPASLVITLAIKFRHVPAWLIGSYEVVWVQAVGLQFYRLHIAGLLKYRHWDALLPLFALIQVAGGVLGIVDATPTQVNIPTRVPTILLSVGGFGIQVVIGLHTLRKFGRNKQMNGAKAVWQAARKWRYYTPAMIVLASIFVVLFALSTAILVINSAVSIDVYFCALNSVSSFWCVFIIGHRFMPPPLQSSPPNPPPHPSLQIESLQLQLPPPPPPSIDSSTPAKSSNEHGTPSTV